VQTDRPAKVDALDDLAKCALTKCMHDFICSKHKSSTHKFYNSDQHGCQYKPTN